MLVKHTHTSFTVGDIERSVRFYTEVLGMKPGKRWERAGPGIEGVTGVKGARLKMASVTLGDFTLELIEYAGGGGRPLGPGINRAGAAHIGFAVKELDGFCEALKAKGVIFYGTPTTLPSLWGGPPIKAVYIAGPDGETVELAEAG